MSFMLSVANKSVMLSVMLNAIMLSVVLLNVVAPRQYGFYAPKLDRTPGAYL